MKLRDLKREAYNRGSNAFSYTPAWLPSSNPDLWAAFVYAVYVSEKLITTSEAMSLCLELESKRASSAGFKALKKKVFEDYRENV